MRTDSTQSPFVAKAHFTSENLWLGRYETFWFQSKDVSKAGSKHSEQWKLLKGYVDNAVIHKAHELVIFDNRKVFVSNYSLPEQRGVNIVAKYINGQLVQDKIAQLSFLDEWTFDQKYLHRLSQMFSHDKHNIEGELHIESETLRDKIHFEKWQNEIEKYKQFQKVESLIKVKV